MQHRNDDILLFIALGDAAAVSTEYVKPRKYADLIARQLRLEGYEQHPTHYDMTPGDYSDDAQRSIAVAETLLTPGITLGDLTELMFIEAMVRGFKRDPRAGYAKGYQKFLESVTDAHDFQRRIRATESEKNGACMGVVPVGVIRDPNEVMRVAAIQARTTHNTEIGIFSAKMVALMSHFFLWQRAAPTRANLGRFLARHMNAEIAKHLSQLARPRRAPVRQPATNTVHAVFDLLVSKNTLAEVLRGAIELGGDTDSVAAIAVGIASARMPNDIPRVMFDQLEPRSDLGPEFLTGLGRKLMDRYA